MEKNKKNIRKKEIVSALIIVLLFFIFRFAISYVCTKASEKRENEILELNMSIMMDVVSDVNTRRIAAHDGISNDLEANMRMMKKLLEEFVTQDGYDGPRTFSDGVVAELQGERVLFPQGFEGLEKHVTREIIEESVKSGAMMSCSITADGALKDALSAAGAKKTGADTDSERYFLSFGEIAPDIIYVDFLTEGEYDAYLERCTRIVNEALEVSNDSFGGMTLVLREKDGQAEFLRQYGTNPALASLPAQELIQQMLRDKLPVISLDGKDYSCAYSSFVTNENEEGALLVIQLIPKVSLRQESAPRVLLMGLVMVIILIAVTVYTTSAQHAMAEQELSEEVRNRYSPKKMRKRMVKTGILSVVVVFAAVVLAEAVGLMYTELRNGRDILNLFSKQLERNSAEEYRPLEREEEEWIVYYGEKLAPLLAEYPKLKTPQKLREISEALGVEMITLFDSHGRQTMCSSDYTGFRLDDEDYPELYDFGRLLYGVPSIIHEVSVDPITGLKRQQIGVTMPVAEHASMHGALIMTLLPEKTARSYDAASSSLLSSASGTICFAADSTDGVIMYSSKPGMTKKLVSECGLSEENLRDSVVDFATITGSDYLMISSRDGKSVFFYAAGTNTVFARILQVGAAVSLIFGAALALLLAILLKGYNEKSYREWEEIREKERERLNQRRARKENKFELSEDSEVKKAFYNKLLDLIGWAQKSAGGKAATVLHIGVLILILHVLEILNGRQLPNDSYGTMLRFFMGGSWMRGLNLFSVCSIMLLIAIAYLINVVCNLLMRLTNGVFSENGETVVRLLYSCVRYITVISVFYFGLEYLGFSTGTIVASLGILSLALSLGAQDLIADILAGLAIVFDGCFKVGDVVEIGGTVGTIEEIGVRSTKLTDSENNTLILNNHAITSILNKSQTLSKLSLELKIPASESLVRLEELLNRELPIIGDKTSLILEGPYLVGLTGLSGSDLGVGSQVLGMTVKAMFNEKDSTAVKVFLNREIHLLFEREGIELL